MTEFVSCPNCGCACRVQAHSAANCVQCFTSFRTDGQEAPRLPYVCRCGQLSGDAKVCDACRAQERAPQGETVRLFEPAPTQLAGQLRL